jgi:hypothetical protein
MLTGGEGLHMTIIIIIKPRCISLVETNLTLIENLQVRICTPQNNFRPNLLNVEWALRPLPTTGHNLTLIMRLS